MHLIVNVLSHVRLKITTIVDITTATTRQLRYHVLKLHEARRTGVLNDIDVSENFHLVGDLESADRRALLDIEDTPVVAFDDLGGELDVVIAWVSREQQPAELHSLQCNLYEVDELYRTLKH